MAKIKKYHTIESKIPAFVKDEYPMFPLLLKKFYEFMETKGAIGAGRDHLDALNFKKYVDSYLAAIKYEHFSDMPESVLLNNPMVNRWSKEFNLSRGSVDSYNFLFRLMYGEDEISIFYPKDHTLRLSDGEWLPDQNVLLLTDINDSLDKLMYQELTQEYPLSNGVTAYASGIITDVERKYFGHIVATEVKLSEITGNFQLGYPVKSVDTEEYLIANVDTLNVGVSDYNYRVDEVITLDTSPTISKTYVYDGTPINTYMRTTYPSSAIRVYVNGQRLYVFSYDGVHVQSSLIPKGASVKIVMPGHKGELKVSSVDSHGRITGLVVEEAIIGDVDPLTAIVADNNNVNVYAKLGTGKIIKGHYSSNLGRPSSDVYLTDSYYYQDYSYVIRTQTDMGIYQPLVNNLLHPSGYKLFGELNINSHTKQAHKLYNQSDIDKTMTTEETARVALGNNYKLAMLSDVVGSGNAPDKRFFGEMGYNDYDYYMVIRDLVEDSHYTFDPTYKSTSNDTLTKIDTYSAYVRENYVDTGYVSNMSDLVFIPIGYLHRENSYVSAGYTTSDYFSTKFNTKEHIDFINTIPRGWMTRSNFAYFELTSE